MKLQRILAAAGIVLLLGLYIVTLVCAIIKTSFTYQLLKASLFATFIIPVMLYAIMLGLKFYKKNEDNENQESIKK